MFKLTKVRLTLGFAIAFVIVYSSGYGLWRAAHSFIGWDGTGFMMVPAESEMAEVDLFFWRIFKPGAKLESAILGTPLLRVSDA